MRYRLILVLILLIAFAYRVIGITSISPPGLEHDEVANWLIDRAILEGQHALYFSEAYGHEAGFHYVQAASVGLLGDHAFALRLPSVFAGLLLVAINYALTRRLFGRKVALLSAALLAVLFWPVFYSRLGLRAIMLPVVGGFAAIFWWQAWQAQRAKQVNGYFVLAGVMAGLSAYTYMASRALPIFFGLFILYLALVHRQAFKRRWQGVGWFVLAYVLFAAPLVFYLQSNPGSEFRISEIDAPLRALLAGDLLPVLTNSLKITGMFGFVGDPLWRQNVAGRPVFDVLTAVLFYAGIFLSFWRWKDAHYAFILLWLGTAAIPSIVTVDAPSSIRMINGLLVVTIFPAIVIHIIPTLSTKYQQLSTKAAYVLAGTLVLTQMWGTAVAVFNTWPNNAEVQFVWQKALTQTAAYLDADESTAPVAVGGWSPDTMDPPTMALSMRRDDLDLRFFGSDSMSAPITTVIIPAAEGAVRLSRPTIRELHPLLEAQLRQWDAEIHGFEGFWLYVLSEFPLVQPAISLNADFDGELRLLGVDIAEPGQILTTWQVLTPTNEARRFFLHAVDSEGNLLTQHDGLDAPAKHWQAGDIIMQVHTLSQELPPGTELRLGVYNPQTNRRLILPDGTDYVILP